MLYFEKEKPSPAFVRQENILTRLWHFSWHVPHDFTLLIVYFMSEIKLAPHKDAHWCRRAAELRYLSAIHVSDSKPGFGRKRTFIWTSRLQRCANAFVLNERSLVIFNLLGKTLLVGLFYFTKTSRSSSPTFHLKWPPSPSSQRESILRFCRGKRLEPTMKISVLLAFSFLLPLIGAQVPHWGPCPEPDVQPGFSLKQVQTL